MRKNNIIIKNTNNSIVIFLFMTENEKITLERDNGRWCLYKIINKYSKLINYSTYTLIKLNVNSSV